MSASIFTIPAGLPFATCLARAVLAGGFPNAETLAPSAFTLPKYSILVPTRRSQRALLDAFLHEGENAALLLPNIRPIGDVDEDEFYLEDSAYANAFDGGGSLEIPPAISKLERQLLLMRLIIKWSDSQKQTEDELAPQITPAQAASLAADLGKLIDAADTDGVDLKNLSSLVPEDYENYWQLTLGFLTIITALLPEILNEKGVIQPNARRNILIRAQTENLERHPPDAPIIAAGSTGSIPATAALLSAIAHLPNGAVVLPGLDLDLDGDAWEKIGPEHPQYGMKQLLEAMDVTRDDVKLLPGLVDDTSRLTVSRLVSEALRPWQTTDQWRDRLGNIDTEEARAAFSGISSLTAPTQREEATAIALIMREVIETPDKTVALVTPDSTLARRVAAQLRRWHLEVDDSAGVPLANTETAVFTSLVIEAAIEGFSAVALLALLKHPLCRLGLEPIDIRTRVRHLEQAILRGPKLKSGTATLLDTLKLQQRRVDLKERVPPNVAALNSADWQDCEDLLLRLSDAAKPLEDIAHQISPVSDIARAHVASCELFAARPGHEGADVLWAEDAGDMLADLFGTLINATDSDLSLALGSYQPMLGVLMLGGKVRAAFGNHPRVFIWGPLEARLQQPDVLIMGSLNEATWPALPDTGPWLSRPMHVALGLQPPERRIGLSAHDFAQAVAAPRVYMTRAEKLNGAPTVPSRWVLRLEAVAAGLGLKGCFKSAEPWLDWTQGLDFDNQPPTPVKAPRPTPPVAARPRRMSVTEIETWIRDPYAIYAKRILRLPELDALEASADASHRGIIVHDAVQKFIEEKILASDEDAFSRLLEIGNHSFDEVNIWPSIRTLWWPRFERIAQWFIDTEVTRAYGVQASLTEVSGKLVFDSAGDAFTLSARADRIDVIDPGNSVVIYDYKTGAVPSASQVFSGLSPQLPLEAAIVAGGGFEAIAAREVARIVYIKLSGGDPAGEQRIIEKQGSDPVSATDAATKALVGLKRRVAKFDLAETPYLSRLTPKFENSTGGYDHLSRAKEWQRFGIEEGE